MNIGQHRDLSAAAEALRLMRSHQPFRFSGKWFVAGFGDEYHAFRSRQPIYRRARAADPPVGTVEVAIVQ